MKSEMRGVACVALCYSLLACSPGAEIENDTANLIAICSAGLGIKNTIELEAGLAEFRKSGRVSAEVREKITGAIFGDAGVALEDKSAAYEKYLKCISGEVDRASYIELLEARRTNIISELESSNDPEVDEIARLTRSHIEATRDGNLALAHELHTEINKRLIESRERNPSNSLYEP